MALTNEKLAYLFTKYNELVTSTSGEDAGAIIESEMNEWLDLDDTLNNLNQRSIDYETLTSADGELSTLRARNSELESSVKSLTDTIDTLTNENTRIKIDNYDKFMEGLSAKVPQNEGNYETSETKILLETYEKKGAYRRG